MIGLKQILRPLYEQNQTRGALKAFVPVRYRPTLRRWFAPKEAVHWCRIVMNREIERFIRSLDCGNLDVLEISGTGSEGRYNFKSYRMVSFPEYDICDAPLARAQFDLVIAEQVFEHVLRPDDAARNVLEMLRPTGHFVISTPFLLKVHGAPSDLYRWTEHGMRELLSRAGFSSISTGSWGNRECLMADMTPGTSWTNYDPQKHSLHNEPQFAIVVWAFAQKPKSD